MGPDSRLGTATGSSASLPLLLFPLGLVWDWFLEAGWGVALGLCFLCSSFCLSLGVLFF